MGTFGGGGAGITKYSWDKNMARYATTAVQAHGLGAQPPAAEVHVKPKNGTDIAGDTITITTDGVNITIHALVGPFNPGGWNFWLSYDE